MKQLASLIKPLLFIAQLLIASWLVLYIEKLQPSDFGRYKSLFVNERKSLLEKRLEAHEVLFEFKQNRLDSLQAIHKLDSLLDR